MRHEVVSIKPVWDPLLIELGEMLLKNYPRQASISRKEPQRISWIMQL